MLTGLLLLHTDFWPFNRLAVLIPLTWWAMYAVNRWQATTPVLGLIDLVAGQAGYWPVPADSSDAPGADAVLEPVPEPLPHPVAEKDQLDEQQGPDERRAGTAAPESAAAGAAPAAASPGQQESVRQSAA